MSERLRFPTTSWSVRLLGAVLLLGGTAALLALPSEALTDGSRLSIIALILLGVVLAGLHSGVRIDPHARRLVRWWGVFAPLRERAITLAHLDAVEVVRSVSRSGQRHQVRFVVRLVDGEQRHVVSSQQDQVRARRHAETVARALAVALDDQTYPGGRRRAPEELDEPLGLRLARRSEVADPGPPPGRIEVIERDGEVSLWLPPAGLRASGAVVLLLPLLTLPISLALFALPMLSLPVSGIAMGAIGATVLLPAVVLAIAGALRAARREVVTVSDVGGLAVGWRLGALGRQRSMAGVEVEELFVSTPRAVSPLLRAGPFLVLRGDEVILTFGRGLTGEEATWLASRLQWELARHYATGAPVSAGTAFAR